MNVKSWKILSISLGCFLTTSCFFDDAKAKADEIATGLNDRLAEAERTADGILEDPELRAEAIEKLKGIIPDSLLIASSLAGEDEGFETKATQLREVLSVDAKVPSSLAGLKHCLNAIPAKFPNKGNPSCYGPSLAYNASLHPDKKIGAPSGPGDCTENCELPGLDLGIWKADEGEQACSAAKLNQLSSNASYYTDVAIGTLSAMVCAAGFFGDSIPTDNVLDLTAKFQKVSEGKITKATITNNNGVYETEFEGELKNLDLWTKVKHNPESKSGLLQIKTQRDLSGFTPKRAISIKYSREADSKTYRMASAGYRDRQNQPANYVGPTSDELFANAFSAKGELEIGQGKWTDDLNILWLTQSKDQNELAYGWQAGSGDGYLRVFNVNSDKSTGNSWFGYSPNENKTMDDVADLLKIDRMICNWAGPGNSKIGQNLTQKQSIKLVAGVWKAEVSNIHYIPVNACSVDEDPSLIFPSITGSGQNDLIGGDIYLNEVKFPKDLI